MAMSSSSLGLQWVPTMMAPPKKPYRPVLVLPQSINQPKQIWRSQMINRVEGWRIRCDGKDDGTVPVQAPGGLRTPMEVVSEFYKLINSKEKTKVLDLISDECYYEDLMFYLPFEGKEEIIKFIHGLMDAMGPHVEFIVQIITNGKNNSASVNWHMEWRKRKIPFTTGYNYFELKEFEFKDVGKKLLIVKIRGLEELPVKPGELILKLLKTVTTLFELYPTATEDLLSDHHNFQDMLPLVLHLIGDMMDHPSTPQ